MMYLRSVLLASFAFCAANADRVGITVQYFDNDQCSGSALAGGYGKSPGGNPPYSTGCINPVGDTSFVGSCPALNTSVIRYWRSAGHSSNRDGIDWQIMDKTCQTASSWSATRDRSWPVPVCQKCKNIFGVACSGAATHLKFSCGDFTVKASDPCFPSSSRATLANGERVRLDALKEGDEIVATDADGSVTTDTVSLLSIAKPEAEATFVNITTAAGKSITLTLGHHLPVGPECCSNLKLAKDVTVGETVWAAAPSVRGRRDATSVDPGVVPQTIKSIAHFVKGRGLHSPVLTNGGFPIVDGIVTAFDSIEKVTLAKHGLAPLLAACKATGTCDEFKSMFLHEVLEYVKSA